MVSVVRRCLLLTLIVSLCGAAGSAETQRATAIESALPQGFSGVIAVSSDTATEAAIASGFADTSAQRKHRIEETWPWASVTKQVTALLVMRQVEAGHMKLDDPIATYVPDFESPAAKTITVRQLLMHTSGLPNPNDGPFAADGVPTYLKEIGDVSDRTSAEKLCAGDLKTTPGSTFSYNNCDYIVLGAALARVTGRPFGSLVAEEIAKPLGGSGPTIAASSLTRSPGDVVGYEKPGVASAPSNLAAFGASANLTGTPEQLLAFDRALLGHRLLSADGTATMWTGEPKLGYVALGAWSFSAPLRGCAAPVHLVERRGEAAGVEVRNVIAPELGRAVAIFTNDESLDFGEIWMGKGVSYDLISAALCPL